MAMVAVSFLAYVHGSRALGLAFFGPEWRPRHHPGPDSQ
jgi:hypothetical protein